jgi:hypothetical protein
MMDGITHFFKLNGNRSKNPRANSIPIKDREKYFASNSENPIGYNCCTSKVEMVPYMDGSGYIFPRAEIKKSPATMALMDQELMLSDLFIALICVKVRELVNQKLELTGY